VLWDRCYDFKNIFAEKFSENIGVFAQTTASFCKNCDHNIFFRKRQFFRRKLAKLAENCDHNIDPWSACLYLATVAPRILATGIGQRMNGTG
jgi:hypothetical protein